MLHVLGHAPLLDWEKLRDAPTQARFVELSQQMTGRVADAGMFDGCMSRESRTALWEATGRPERMTFISNHKWSFIFLTPVVLDIAGNKIYRFLSRDLAHYDGQLVARTLAPKAADSR